MGKLSVMGAVGPQAMALVEGIQLKPGHATVTWDVDDAEATDVARRVFSELVGPSGRGFAAFGRRGASPAEQLREFDPQEEAIVLTMPMAGG